MLKRASSHQPKPDQPDQPDQPEPKCGGTTSIVPMQSVVTIGVIPEKPYGEKP